MLVCEGCGKTMTASTDRLGVPSYRCMSYFKQIPCPKPRWRIHESHLEQEITEIISRLELPSDWRSRIEQLINTIEEHKNIEQERARLQEKMRRLKSAYFEVIIDEEEFRRRKTEVEQSLARLKPSPIAKVEVSVRDLEIMRLAWQGATKEQRSEIVSTLFEAIYCEPGEKRLVALQPKRAFAPLLRQIEGLREDERKFYVAPRG